jgi:predicted RNA-binding Zn-ribbon protein involved in translation (DUF1610 family)
MPVVKQGKAVLRVCASCEWIFKEDKTLEWTPCPKCGFGHYSARYVYGNKCYRYAVTQQPWVDHKVKNYTSNLLGEVYKTNPNKDFTRFKGLKYEDS